MRTTALIASIIALTSSLGCENARQQQQKAEQAQVEADQKVAEAQREANDKSVEAQRVANDKSVEARADADKKTADAVQTFTKIREDYRHDVTTKLADLDRKIADLDVKAQALKQPKRGEMNAKLEDIRHTREAFVKEYQTIETASAATWDDTKKRLDKSLSELEAKIEHA